MVKIPVKTAKDEEKNPEELQSEQDVQDVQNEETSSSEEQQETPVNEVPDGDVLEGEVAEIEEPADETPVTTDDSITEEGEAAEEAEEEDELSRLTKELEAKEQEIREHYEARLRLQAEFDNFKKRREKETLDFRKYANEGLLQDVLTVVDDFERAISAAEQTHKLEDFLKGVELIFNKFLDTLKKKGVTEIEAETGQAFNPAIHEAVTQIETDEVEEGTIFQVLQKGYYLHDRVLRAPKVAVAKAKD